MRLVKLVAAIVSSLLLVSSAPPAVAADPPVVSWFARSGMRLEDVARDGSGGAVVAGRQSWGADHSGVIARYGPDGDLIWSDTWAPVQGSVRANAVAVAPHGGVVAVGGIECDSYEAVGPFVRSYTAAGALRWSIAPKGDWCPAATGSEHATDVAIAHGLVLVVGHEFGCCGMALDDGWIRAYDFHGDKVWHRNFEVPGVTRRTNDLLSGVAPTSNGFVVTGSVNVKPGDDTATPVDSEIVVQTIDVTGEVGWTTVLRDRGVKDFDYGYDVAARGGSIVAVGSRDRGWSLPSPEHGWVARFAASDGDLRWLHRWGRETSTNGVAIATDGVIWTVGEGSDRDGPGTDLLMRTYDPRGRLLWRLHRGTVGRWGTGTAVAPEDDGAFVSGSASGKRDGGRLWRFRYEA
jgi:hypothetical protein